ncbi:uncharacterized protein E5676_scaffold344G00240 [Cucumis melo var. makuwa]|uniref:Uncharacterized protein n=1 Tax=Cucumis melo var. makuwa TaxID=1194695 RepID=A0A5A7VKW4_CUCMM|nr:uncharacterized protein E6C27_scaffold62G00360 [Cucumis melo var. makuwa]TYK30270.1 uncharacterized protein E5676_scaffold344G00240 [Cucumis melo var. makuwa]
MSTLVVIQFEFERRFRETTKSLEDGGQSTVDEFKEMNLGIVEEPCSTSISVSLSSEEEGKYMSLLTEYRYIFVWSYKEMLGLDPKVVVHLLAIKLGYRSIKKMNGQLRICVDFRYLNNAYLKDDFSFRITDFMVDATAGHETLSLMDRSSGYVTPRSRFSL